VFQESGTDQVCLWTALFRQRERLCAAAVDKRRRVVTVGVVVHQLGPISWIRLGSNLGAKKTKLVRFKFVITPFYGFKKLKIQYFHYSAFNILDECPKRFGHFLNDTRPIR
jgi:hypothetical protein